MKLVILLILFTATMTLAGCGWLNRSAGYLSGYSTVCVKETGVLYVQFPSGAAVLVDRGGKPMVCQP